MNEITKELLDALKGAVAQMNLAAECVERGRHDEAILHLRSLTRGRSEAIAKAEAALVTPQPSADGWIPWEGGDCPVETKGHDLFLRFRDGSEHSDYVTRARGYDCKWERRGHPADIIAYRVVKP